MMPQRPRSHWLRASVVIVSVSLATLLLEHLGWLDRFETTSLDAFNIFQQTDDPADVVMIGISDDDYQRTFGAKSPLDCGHVKEILDAILAGKPRMVGVDLETASGDFSCLRLDQLSPDAPPIVWAQDAVRDPPNTAFTPMPVLNGATRRPLDLAGIVQFPVDADGVIRRYARHLATTQGAAASFPWLVAKTACAKGCAACCTESESGAEMLRLNFAGDRFNFTPLSVQPMLMSARSEGWATAGPLRDRIVLVGGDYRAARDRHATPIGERSGLQLLAQSIESELQHRGIRTLNWAIAFVLDLVAGFLLVAVHLRFERRPAITLVTSLVLMPVLALVSSRIAFATLSLWFNFVPLVVSVVIHQLYEHTREYSALKSSTHH